MGFNVSGGQVEPKPAQIVIDNFSGLVTNMTPNDVPAGASPDCAENGFSPGSTYSRPCFRKVFAAPLYPASERTYGKSFVDNAETVRNLYFYKNGAITVENVTVAPGIETLLAQTSALNCFAKSITAFGREYIAISDGQHGQEVPLQLSYDALGNAQLDRYTQDGPGSPPTISSLALPPVAMLASGPALVLTVTSAATTGFITVDVPDGTGGTTQQSFFTQIVFGVAAGANGLSVGGAVTIAGNSFAGFNATFTVAQIVSDTEFIVSAYNATAQAGVGGTATSAGGLTMIRANNIVSVSTAAPHQLQPGYLAQIAGMTALAVGGGIASIVINNEDAPGLATVTTNTPHGLAPQNQVTLGGIDGVSVGGSTSASRQGGVITFTTATPHGLSPGASVTFSGFMDTTFNSSFFVNQVIDPLNFTVIQNEATNATASSGATVINWPIPDTATPTFYEVQTAPTPTTFTVQISYCDGTWSSGTVSFAWDGQFFIQSVPTPNSFTYKEYGPNGSTTQVGTVTPYGQAAPGLHQVQVLFEDRQGGITSPSPPVNIESPGGQYFSVSNIPIGPPNIVKRILAFTGAGGSEFFYLPVADQVQGQITSTSTVLNDNTTTSAILDFGDPALFRSLAISTPGNDLANQIVLDSALGFGSFELRLVTYGQRNRVQSGEGTGGFLNLGFDGGSLPTSIAIPTGWNSLGPNGSLEPAHFGIGWQITAVGNGTPYGELSQSAYQDVYGDPIISGNTTYRLRVWLKPSLIDAGVNFTAALTSASTGFSSIAVINGAAMSMAGSFIEAAFSAITPAAIPVDLVLNIYLTSATQTAVILIDEISIIYAEEPYLKDCFASYVNNPAGIDGVTGVFGPDDNRPVFGMGIIRQALRLITQDPGGRLHVVSGTANTEPSGWEVDEEAANCGLVSTFALTLDQANDESASGGPEWMAWISSVGILIFGGQEPMPISAEIQSDPTINPYGVPDFSSLNTAAQLKCWALNDPRLARKTIYFGIPTGNATAPNLILPVNYIGLSSAEQIADSPPVHLALSGKMIARDLSRKWTRWKRPMNAAAMMYRNPSSLQPVFMGGATANGTAFGNCYTLDQALKTDDDYGAVAPYYTTTATPTSDEEQQYQTGSMLKILAYLTAAIQWLGNLNITVFGNDLNNPFPCLSVSAITNLTADLEWGPPQSPAQRFFLRVGSSPLTGQTDNSFLLTKVAAVVKVNARAPVRGAFK